MVDFPAFKISLNATHVHSKISFSRNKKFGWSTTLSSRCQDARNIIPKKVDSMGCFLVYVPLKSALFASKNLRTFPYKFGWFMWGNPSKNYHIDLYAVSLIPPKFTVIFNNTCYRHSTADWTSMVDLLDCRDFVVVFSSRSLRSEKIVTLAPVSREPSTSTKPRTVHYTWKLVGGGPRNRAESGVQVVI